MKIFLPKTFILFIFMFFFFAINSFSQTYYYEDFEAEEEIPTKWNEYVTLNYDWDTLNGGHRTNPGIPTSGNPENAYEGNRNAIFFAQSLSLPSTFMVLPSIDLEFAIRPDLVFAHAQEGWVGKWDNLKVWYRYGTSKDSTWYFLQEYPNETPDNVWSIRTIQLPDEALTDSCTIGFQGTSNTGHGVCIDSILVIERGEIQKELDTLTISRASTQFVVSESAENAVVRINLRITGNTGNIILDSLTVTSLNTDDDNILANGVKLFLTDDTIFNATTQLGVATSLNNGKATFTGVNYYLPTGYSYVWVTYDIASDPTHDIHNNRIDAKFEANSIHVSGNSYPATEQSPNGSRLIYESVFYDNFETDKTWALSGEFQRDMPSAKGGVVGNPDPGVAYQGNYVLGSDLTGLVPFPGDYDTMLVDRAYKAITPTINCNYYRSLNLIFYRWLNVDILDSASIDISTNNGVTWKNIYRNGNYIRDNQWILTQINIPTSTEYKEEVKLRFNIGPTPSGKPYSGWNIDNFSLFGNYISSDVQVSELLAPIDGCGHTSTDSVTVRVTNMGGTASPSKIPVTFSPDGGIHYINDTIFDSLPVGGDTIFTFNSTIDLSNPGYYTDAYAATSMPGDEWEENDTLHIMIYATPTYSLPYFSDSEAEEAYWVSGGTNSSWEYGIPSGSTINPQTPGNKSWITKLAGNYNNNEDSYVESPCVDFIKSDYPLVEMKIWVDTEEEFDAGALQYSLDGGNNWFLVDSLTHSKTPNWEWYNDYDVIPALGTVGWNTVSGSWYTVKTFLPQAIINKPSVKFRMHFASNASNNSWEGIAFDDIKFYEAPFDIGVDSVFNPQSSCELSSDENIGIFIKNYGLDSLNIGDTVFIKIDFQYESDPIAYFDDTCILTKNLPPDSTYAFTINETVNMTSEGSYSITAYTINKEIPEFYNLAESNDTTIASVYVYGNPLVDLGDTIYTVHPDTVVINAWTDPINTYLWQDASTDSVYNVLAEGRVYVTVTNGTTGCYSIDSVDIVRLIPDIGFDSLISPVADCELGSSVFMEARFTNFGTDTIFIGDSILLGFDINSTVNIDTLVIPVRVSPGESYNYTFTQPADMSVLDTIYNIKIFTKLEYDLNYNNDTLIKPINVWGYPAFNLEPDTLVEALSYELNAGDGYESYLWDDNSTDSIFTVTQDGNYSVTVTDIHGCSSSDNTNISLWIHDLIVSELLGPSPDCELEEKTPVSIRITNNGTDTLHVSDSILIAYDLNTTQMLVDTIILESQLLPGANLDHTFTDSTNMVNPQIYNFAFYPIWIKDMRPENDTLNSPVEVYGYPNPDLGNDTVVSYFEYELNPGVYTSYLWHDSSTDPTFTVNETNETMDNYYSVTVVDSHGCSNYDSVMVILEVTDVSIAGLTAPVSACHYSDPVSVSITVTNLCNYTMNSGFKIPVSYKLNSEAYINDTIVLSQSLNPGANTAFTFKTKANIQQEITHQFTIVANLQGDVIPGNNSLISNVTVYGSPNVTFDYDTLYFEASVPIAPQQLFNTYSWSKGSSQTIISTQREITVTEAGTYYVKVKDDFGCSGEGKIYCEKSTGIDNMIEGSGYQISYYPNPASDKLMIQFDNQKSTDVIIEIINTNGQILYNNKLTNIQSTVERIDVNSYAKGVYYIRFRVNNEIYTRKLIFQ